jgi:hypothetical protein
MMMDVACVWVEGHVPYSIEYVIRLQQMVAKHLSFDHRFVCLTDRPWLLPDDMKTLPVPSPRPHAGWWAKLQLFNRAVPLADRVLYLDLDSLVVRSLDPIATYDAPLALVPHTGATSVGTRYGQRVVKKFNSSVMAFSRPETFGLWEAYRQDEHARTFHGDQDYIGELMPDAAIMPTEWFPRVSMIGRDGHIPKPTRVILSKKPKNLECAKWPWFNAIWRAE